MALLPVRPEEPTGRLEGERISAPPEQGFDLQAGELFDQVGR